MSSPLVVDTTIQDSIQNADVSILGYESILPSSAISGEAEDPDFPFSNALDYRDNTKYSPVATNGTVVINFTQGAAQTVNYFAFAIHNSQDAGLSGQLEVDSGAGFEIVAEFSGVTSNKPMLYYFGDKQTSTQRLTLNFTSKLYIGSINVGNAIVFQRPPSLGYQQASTAPLDKVEQFTTEGNNFIVGRRLSRGFQDKGTFRFLSIDEATWFEDYQNHVLDSKTLYFKWNNQKPQTTYGLQNPQNLTKPTYVTSFHFDFSFDINGYA